MTVGRRFLTAMPALGAAWMAAAVLRAAHRSDLPSFPNSDASGVFGDPSLPLLRMVAVGDSSLTGPGLRHLDSIFIRRIARSYADRHHVELISLGVGGSKAQDVIEGQLEEAVALHADVAVVSVGSNDAIRAISPGRYQRRVDGILGRLEETAGAVVVIGMGDLGMIPRLPATLRPYLRRRSRHFDAAATRATLRHPRAVKVHTGGRITDAFDGRDPSVFAADLFHAADEGHRVFAEEAAPAFDRAYRIAMRRRVAGRSG